MERFLLRNDRCVFCGLKLIEDFYIYCMKRRDHSIFYSMDEFNYYKIESIGKHSKELNKQFVIDFRFNKFFIRNSNIFIKSNVGSNQNYEFDLTETLNNEYECVEFIDKYICKYKDNIMFL